MTTHAEEFVRHRPALVGAAYRVLGSAHDAEDVVQEAWLRWSQVDLASVETPRAFLLRTTTRLALNRIRQEQRRREDYIGPWLPEPLAGTAQPGDAEGAVELAESVSMAMLVVLGSLSPLERAAFVLREVFDVPYDEIAATLERSEQSVRQLAHRARSHVQARAPRHPVDPATHHAVTVRFLEAMRGGSVDDLVALMSPEVVLITDGGGKRQAALRPISGPDNIVRFLLGVLAKPDAVGLEISLAQVNGRTAVIGTIDGVPDTVGILEIDGGVVSQIFMVRNPDKLSAVSL